MERVRQEMELTPREFEARRRWAKRQGRPHWLWPEVAPSDWSCALTQIEEIAREVLLGRPVRTMPDGDPAALDLACYTSGLGPLLGWWWRQGLLLASPAIAALLDQHFDHNRRRMQALARVADELAASLGRQGIAGVLLKGMHTAGCHFPDPAARPVSDIDLLVAHEARQAAEALLRGLGYHESGSTSRESTWRRPGTATVPRTLTYVHADDPWSIDLHYSLDIPVAGGARAIPLDRLEPMRTGGRWAVNPGLMVLDQPLQLLHLAAHAGAGLHNMTLVRLVELHLVIRREETTGSLDWRAFLELGERGGALGHACPALWLCERLVPGTVPGAVLDRCVAHAPPRVRKLVTGLSPARAQRICENSLREHFMWAGGAGGMLRQLRHDLVQRGVPFKSRLSVYERRVWQLVRGAFSR